MVYIRWRSNTTEIHQSIKEYRQKSQISALYDYDYIYCQQNNVCLTRIKIDTEGYEMKKFAVTVDLEKDFGKIDSYSCIKLLPSFLKIIEKNDIQATFFITSDVIKKFPILIKKLSKRHEIACHGHRHCQLTKMDIAEVKIDLIKSLKIFSKELGVSPIGFRAPFFSINSDILEVLKESGFKYDSSLIFGFLPNRYLNLNVSRRPYYITKGLLEIPVSSIGITPLGTTWLQFLGYDLFNRLFQFFKPETPIMYSHMSEFSSSNTELNFYRKVFYWRRGRTVLKEFDDFLSGVKDEYEFVCCQKIVASLKKSNQKFGLHHPKSVY